MDIQHMLHEDMSITALIHLAFLRGTEYERIDEEVVGTRQVWAIACTPNLQDLSAKEPRGPWHRSDDPRAVTCPACKQTDIFRQKTDQLKTARKHRRK